MPIQRLFLTIDRSKSDLAQARTWLGQLSDLVDEVEHDLASLEAKLRGSSSSASTRRSGAGGGVNAMSFDDTAGKEK